MLVDQFDNLMEAQPFKPFRMYMSDGPSIYVKGRNWAWHAPASRTVYVASRDVERVHIIDLHLVTRFTTRRDGETGNGKHKNS